MPLPEARTPLDTYEARAEYVRGNFAEMVDLIRSATFLGTELTPRSLIKHMPDVVQQTLDRFHASYDPSKSKPDTFLWLVAVREAIREVKKDLRLREREVDDHFTVTEVGHEWDFAVGGDESSRLAVEEPRYEGADIRASIETALEGGALPKRAREFIRLLDEGYSMAGAAVEMGVTVQRCHQMKDQIADYFRRVGII